jgi:hypothetical protein
MLNNEAVQEVKRIFINPLESFNTLLEMGLPKSKYEYVSNLYQSLNPILSGVYKLDILQTDIDRLLGEREVTDDQLEEIMTSSLINRKVKLYNDIMVQLKDDIVKIETKYSNKLGEKAGARKAAASILKILNKVEIDPDSLVEDLITAGVSEHHADTFAAIVCKITNHMIRQLIKMADSDKDGMIMDSSIKKENQEMLNEEVNKLDKEQGLNLKKPKGVPDYEKIYDLALGQYRTYLALVILNLNDLRIDKFFEFNKKYSKTRQIKKIKPGNKPFRKFSPFFSDDNEDEYETDMVMYRGRFLT